MIGTLIETNDRIIAALEMYDTVSRTVLFIYLDNVLSLQQLSKSRVTEQNVEDVQKSLAAVNIHDSELGKLQEKQRAAVQRSIGRSSSLRALDDEHLHPDLQDLNFESLGAEQRYGDILSKVKPPF